MARYCVCVHAFEAVFMCCCVSAGDLTHPWEITKAYAASGWMAFDTAVSLPYRCALGRSSERVSVCVCVCGAQLLILVPSNLLLSAPSQLVHCFLQRVHSTRAFCIAHQRDAPRFEGAPALNMRACALHCRCCDFCESRV